MTLNGVFEEYINYIQNKKSKGTVLSAKQRYENHFKERIGEKEFLKITAREISDIQLELSNN